MRLYLNGPVVECRYKVSCICNDALQVYGGQAATNERQDEGSAEKNAPGGKVIIMTIIMKTGNGGYSIILRLLELPTSVGTACPSPPQHTLSSLRLFDLL